MKFPSDVLFHAWVLMSQVSPVEKTQTRGRFSGSEPLGRTVVYVMRSGINLAQAS